MPPVHSTMSDPSMSMQTPDMLFGLLKPECYQTFFVKYDFFNARCLQLLISKFLSLGIIAGAVLVKLPQIIAIIRSRSAAGVAPSMFILENISYTIFAAYNYRHNYNFTTYGETVFLLIQGFILVLLISFYNKTLFSPLFISGVIAYLTISYSLFNPNFTNLSLLNNLQSSTILLNIMSRLPQIIYNYNNKSTGQLSFITCLLNFFGTFARVFTTITEVNNDNLMLISCFVGTFLNGILLAQVLYYNYYLNNTSKTITSTTKTTTTTSKPIKGE